MSYFAGWPVPSSTSVNASVTEDAVVLATARSNTVPGWTGLPAVTVTAAVPLFPSLVAVIVAAPLATPVTRPPVDTAATAGALDAQVISRPDSGIPFASSSVAVSCAVCPTWMPTDTGLTLTDATGTRFTVTAALPVFPSLVAVIVTAPAPAPVTSPVAVTVATAGVLDAQVTDRPKSTLPAASFSVAVSCTVAPTSTTAVAGLITTDATGTFATLIVADALCPSLVAVIVAAPAATPVTSPVADTVAIAGFALAQLITRPVSTFPAASLVTALSCVVPPTKTLAVAGLTTTEATGTLDTVTAAVPLCPSLVALIVAAPTATPITSPLADTVAAAVFELAHATTRPASTFPAASLVIALSCVVPPTKTFAAAGLTTTEATGTLDTVTAAVPLCPSLVAVIVAAPTAAPVTRPLAETVATAPLLVAQLTTRPLSGLPLASLGVAVSCTVPPTYRLGAVGLTVTDATGTFATVTLAVPLGPSLVAVIVAVPAATPVTSPVADTLAIAPFALAHVTTRPVSTLPAASFGVALSSVVAPTKTFAVAGLTVTDATGTFATVTLAVPLCPSLVAVIVTAPAATPVTSPVADTLAIAPFALAHVTTRPVSALPAASFGVALSCCVAPSDSVADAGLTATEATETVVTARSAVPAMPLAVPVTM